MKHHLVNWTPRLRERNAGGRGSHWDWKQHILSAAIRQTPLLNREEGGYGLSSAIEISDPTFIGEKGVRPRQSGRSLRATESGSIFPGTLPNVPAWPRAS